MEVTTSFASGFLDSEREANMFSGRDRGGAVKDLTVTMQAPNIIHPFREGNGRTQRILTEHVAEHAGYVLDWHRIEPEQQNAMMRPHARASWARCTTR